MAGTGQQTSRLGVAGKRNAAQDTRGDSVLFPPHLRGRPADTRSGPSEPRWGHEGGHKGATGGHEGATPRGELIQKGPPRQGGLPLGATSGGHQPASRCKHTESILSPLLVVLPTVVAHPPFRPVDSGVGLCMYVRG